MMVWWDELQWKLLKRKLTVFFHILLLVLRSIDFVMSLWIVGPICYINNMSHRNMLLDTLYFKSLLDFVGEHRLKKIVNGPCIRKHSNIFTVLL